MIEGRDCGMKPTVETPSASRPANQESAMPAATARSGAGECGQSRSIARSATSAAAAIASVSSEVSDRWPAMLRISRKKPSLVK
ncbi:hypothetical protein D9M72_634880 [compost metagenome]